MSEHIDAEGTEGDASPQRRSLTEAAVGGAVIGLAAGAAVGGSRGDGLSAGIGAIAGALAGAAAETITERGRNPLLRTAGRSNPNVKPEWHRIGMAVWLAAALGGLVDLATDSFSPTAFAVALGFFIGIVGTVGLLSFRRNRLLLGLLVGLAVGLPADLLFADPWLAVLAALVALAYRLIGRFWFAGRDMAEVLGERLDRAQVPFVAPYTSRTRQVGVEWARRTADDHGWTYGRNAPGIGIVASLDELRSPTFDPSAVARRVRNFYEHTSDYKLTITPVWSRRAQPLYWLFKQLIASRIRQANLPFTQAEAQRGVVSAIETLTVPDETPTTLRVWTRSYAATGEALYVGVYTTYRHDDGGFVSVGFPLPSGNFTATLRASNAPDHTLLLRTRDDDSEHAGHYLSAVEPDGRLTVVKIPALDEEIHVFDDAGALHTEHRFLVWGQTFLSLNYTMESK